MTETQQAMFERAHELRAHADRLAAEHGGAPEVGTPEGDAVYEADHAAAVAADDYEASLHPDYSAMTDVELGDREFWADMRALWMEGGYDPPTHSAQMEACERISQAHREDTERALAAREAEAG
jgi:hypothetical protein